MLFCRIKFILYDGNMGGYIGKVGSGRKQREKGKRKWGRGLPGCVVL